MKWYKNLTNALMHLILKLKRSNLNKLKLKFDLNVMQISILTTGGPGLPPGAGLLLLRELFPLNRWGLFAGGYGLSTGLCIWLTLIGLCMGLCICMLKLLFEVDVPTGLGLFRFDCIEFEAGLLSKSRLGLGLGVGGAMLDAGLFRGIENGLPGELMFWPWIFCIDLTVFIVLTTFDDCVVPVSVTDALKPGFIPCEYCRCGWNPVDWEELKEETWLNDIIGSLDADICCTFDVVILDKLDCIVPRCGMFVVRFTFEAWFTFAVVVWIDSLGVLVNMLELVPELEICEIVEMFELGCCDIAEFGTCAIFDDPTMCGAMLWMLCIVWNGNCALLEFKLVGVRPVARAFTDRLRPWFTPEFILVAVKFAFGLIADKPDTPEFAAVKLVFNVVRLWFTFDEFKFVKFGLTPVSPAFTPDSPELMFVEFIVLSLFIPVFTPVFMLFKSCPKLDKLLLMLFEPMLDVRLELIAFMWFKLGFIAVNPVFILGRPKLCRGFDVVITLEVRDVRLVFRSDSGNPILRPTPKVGVAGGRPIPVPEGFMVLWFNWFNWFT